MPAPNVSQFFKTVKDLANLPMHPQKNQKSDVIGEVADLLENHIPGMLEMMAVDDEKYLPIFAVAGSVF